MLKLGRDLNFAAIMEGIMSKRIIIVACVLILLSSIPGGSSSVSVAAEPLACEGAFCIHMPLVSKPFTPQHFPIIARPAPVVETALIFDHRHIDITKIPDYWLEQARNIMFHYGHTSHGSQIISGLDYIDTYYTDPKYNFTNWGLWEWNNHLTDGLLPRNLATPNIYDGNYIAGGGDDYIEPGDYWDGSTGIARTTTTAASGNFDYSMWSWCGQADTDDSEWINSYLEQMSAFETAFPDMRFILMTGHNVGDPGTNLLARNQQMRDYAIANHMILFDFADIETYTPDGTFFDPAIYNYSDGGCPWCASWCTTHASYCDQNTLNISCAHTHPLFCKMKAQAYWWMLARLAGWNGITTP